MNLSGAKDSSERTSPFTNVQNLAQFTIQPSSSHTNQQCPVSIRSPIQQMTSQTDNDEQRTYLRTPQVGIRNFCDSVASHQEHHPSAYPCEYGSNDQLWHSPLLNDDVVRLSSLLPQSLLTSAFPAHLLLTGRSFLESNPASVPSRNALLLPKPVHAKDRAFSSDGSSLSLDGYHKSKCFKDATSQVKDDSQRESDDENRIDVCNVKEVYERETVSPSTAMQDQDTQKYEENSEDDSNSLTSLIQMDGQCARTVPGLLKYYARHKWSLSSSLTVSLAVTGQSTPPSSPISPGTFQRPIVSSAQLHERLVTVNSSDEVISNTSEASLPSSVVPLLTVPKIPLISTSMAASSSLKNTSSHRLVTENFKTSNKDMTEKIGKINKANINSKPQPTVESYERETKLLKTCEPSPKSGMLESPNVLEKLAEMPPMYRTGLSIGMDNLPSRLPIATSTYRADDIARHAALLLSQGIDPTMAARIGLGYQFVRDPVTGHIILLPNSHHLPSTNSSLLWTGYGGVAASPLVMASQQLLLNESHYRHPIHPHLLHVPQHHMQLNKNEGSSLKYGSHNTPLAPVLPSDLPPTSISPHILYPSTTLPCYLTAPGQQMFPLSNYNTQVDTFNLSLSSTPSENGCTNTTNSMSCRPIVVTTTPNDYNPSLSLSSNKKNIKVLPYPNHHTVPFNDSAMEPPMDLTKKKKRTDENTLLQLSVNTDTASLLNRLTEPISVKKEIKLEILSPNQAIFNERHKNSFEDVILKEECFSDTYEPILTQLPRQQCTPDRLQSFNDEETLVPHMPVSPATIQNTKDGTLCTTADNLPADMDVSGLNLLSFSIQQHEDNHQLSATNSDEETSCIEMPTLERINLSPSPRHSPLSCELPPVLTPVEINDAPKFDILRDGEHQENINNTSVMPTKYSGLRILCVLAEQELNEKNNNCSALTSLAEVAATHQSIKETDDFLDSPRQQLPILNEYEKDNEIPQQMDVFSDTKNQHNLSQLKPWPNSIDINRNYKDCWQTENMNLISDHPKLKTSFVSEKMNGREIKVRIQLAELQRKYKKKRQKLTKLHKKKNTLKKTHCNLSKLNLHPEHIFEHHYQQPEERFATIVRPDVSNTPIQSSLNHRLNEIFNVDKRIALQSEINVDEVNKAPRSNSPVINFSVEDIVVSDTDQQSSSSKRKPGRPKKYSIGDDELVNSKQNFDFMMISHKPKILPKLRAELKVRESDHIDDHVDYISAHCNDDDSDDDLPLSTFQQKSMERYTEKSSSFSKVKKNQSHIKLSLTRRVILSDKEKRKKSIEKQSNMEELFRSLKRHSKMAAEEHDESDEEK